MTATQAAALKPVAQAIVVAILKGLAVGTLVVVDGVVVPAGERMVSKTPDPWEGPNLLVGMTQ